MRGRFVPVLSITVAVGCLAWAPLSGAAGPEDSADRPVSLPRVVITADPELDDNNTLIRALLYSNEVQLEGLVYVSSQFHWRGDGKGTTQFIAGREYTRLGLCPCTSWRFAPHEHFMDTLVGAYARVYRNLEVHDRRYPSPAYLRSRIRWGNVDFDGDFSADTAGSNLIKSLLLDDRPGPLYVTAQGGQSTIARALKSIHDQFVGTPQWQNVREKVSRKLIVIPSGDQDGTGASYIHPNWPQVREYDFAGIYFGYGLQSRLDPALQVYFGPAWTRDHVTSRGPLGAQYRVWGDGRQMVPGDRTDYFGLSGYSAGQLRQMGYLVWMPLQPKGAFLGEGDTPTFLNLVDNGLEAIEDPRWGGWGGWMRPGTAAPFGLFGPPPPPLPPDTSGAARGLAAAGQAVHRPATLVPLPGRPDTPASAAPAEPPRLDAIATRLQAAAQNDFAARLQWSVTAQFRGANHPPVVRLTGPYAITAHAGGTVVLRAIASDPDADAVTVTWWSYPAAGTYPGEVRVSDPHSLTTQFTVPSDARPGQTLHLILEATDDGSPPLTRYQRVVITVQ